MPNVFHLRYRQYLSASICIFALPLCLMGQDGFDAQQAQQHFELADGLQVQLVAAEPLVQQPVTMSIDHRGRIWVIQYLQYPEPAGLQKVAGDQFDRIQYDRVPDPPPHGPRGRDRVTILEDHDGDGVADSAHDFIDGLNIASGLALGHGGVWVLQSPYLLFYPDRDHDDRPDADPEVRLVGFGLDDAHSVANSLQWGPDGWLYGAHGSTVNADVRGIKFQQGIWRYHPITDRFELFSEGGGNTYGLDFDSRGQAIAGTNWGLAGLHQLQGAYYQKIFGKHGALHNPFTFGYFEHMPHHGESIGKLSVGGIFYDARAWPARFHGKFILANPLNHALYAIELRPQGSTYTTQFQERIMGSRDSWFQPVDLALAPDGSLLVADWYDGNINYQVTYRNRKQFDPERGRIYRITAGPAKGSTAMAWELADDRQWMEALQHENVWYRRHARQLLREQKPMQLAKALRAAIDNSPDERMCLESLWSYYALSGLGESDANDLLNHRYAAIREWTVRLIGDEPVVTDPLASRLVSLAARETDIRVRAQLACTAKRLDSPHGWEILQSLLQQDEDIGDRYLPLLIWWGVEAKSMCERQTILQTLSPDSLLWQRPLFVDVVLPRLARRYVAESNDPGYEACAHLLAAAPSAKERARIIAGMREQLQGTSLNALPQPLTAIMDQLWQSAERSTELVLLALHLNYADARSVALEQIGQPALAEADRLGLLSALATSPDAELQTLLIDLVKNTRESTNIRGAALANLGRFGGPHVADAILQSYRDLPPQLQGPARELLYGRSDWSLALLQAIEAQTLGIHEIPLSEIARFSQHNDSEIQALVSRLWGQVRPQTSAELRQRMSQLGQLLTTATGDPAPGKPLFQTSCGTCHRLHGEGNQIGPDLTPYPRHDLAYLLLHIVDPSAVIRPPYQAVTVATEDGRILTGLIAETTPTSLTILDAKNQRIQLGRDEIEQSTDLPTSLMPTGLVDMLDDEQIRNLFAYLRSGTTEPLRDDLRGLPAE